MTDRLDETRSPLFIIPDETDEEEEQEKGSAADTAAIEGPPTECSHSRKRQEGKMTDRLDETRGPRFSIPDETEEQEEEEKDTTTNNTTSSSLEDHTKDPPTDMPLASDSASKKEENVPSAATETVETPPPDTTEGETTKPNSSTETCANEYLSLKTENSPFFHAHPPSSLPVLALDEITLGHFLGQGEFGRVYEVIQILDNDNKKGSSSLHLHFEQLQQSSTAFSVESDVEPFRTTAGMSSVQNRSMAFSVEEEDAAVSFTKRTSPTERGGTAMNASDRTHTNTSLGGLEGDTDDEEHPIAEAASNHDQTKDNVIDKQHLKSRDKKEVSASSSTSSCGGETDEDEKEDKAKELLEIFSGTKDATANTVGSSLTTAPFMLDKETAKRSRTILKKRCWKDGKARYAAKQLRKDLGGKHAFANTDNHSADDETSMPLVGAMDLAFEGRLLASLAHPNIVKLRATVGLPGQPQYTLLMDRLHMTLEDKISEWNQEKMGGYGSGGKGRRATLKKVFSKVFVGGGNGGSHPKKGMRRLQKQGQFLLRLYTALDVARALRYLHDNNIVFRDLKPQNIGYDLRGDVKVFDFGLAKELLDEDLVSHPDGYNATGMTGTLRWMSPEVYFSHPYGLSADVYSFGLLLWNLCYLETPFAAHSALKAFHRNVMVKSKRPTRQSSSLVSNSLWSTMSLCWSRDPTDRPDFDIVCDVLRSEISTLRDSIDKSSAELAQSGTLASSNLGSSNMNLMDASAPEQRQLPPNKKLIRATSSPLMMRGKLAKTYSLRASFKRARGAEPVDRSCHHNGPTHEFSPTQLLAEMGHRQDPLPLRRSTITRRSQYLEEKSTLSLANIHLSSHFFGNNGTKV